MERMTEKKIGKRKVKVHRMEGLYPYVRLEDFMQVCKGLEEENKKLKEMNSKLGEMSGKLGEWVNNLEEENKKLNIKVASLEGEIKGLNYTIEKLHKEIEEQEAEGGGLFDEIDYRKREAKRLGWKPNN